MSGRDTPLTAADLDGYAFLVWLHDTELRAWLDEERLPERHDEEAGA